MRRYLIDFLKSLEEILPPPKNCHHAMTFAKYGSDETGWEEKLALQCNIDGQFFCAFLDDEDLSHAPEQLAAEIARQMRGAETDERAQRGIALGQYVRADGE
jgi:hypothetical protein